MGIRSQSSKQSDLWGLHVCPGEMPALGCPLGAVSGAGCLPGGGEEGGSRALHVPALRMLLAAFSL